MERLPCELSVERSLGEVRAHAAPARAVQREECLDVGVDRSVVCKSDSEVARRRKRPRAAPELLPEVRAPAGEVLIPGGG